MPILIGTSASPYVAPTIAINASTDYNQNSAVLNATVTTTGNRPITSVEFQWSTSSTFASGNSAWTAASTNTTISQGATNTARTLSISGLSNGTAYYVRCRATNASSFVTTSAIGGGFTTYSLRTVPFTGSSTWSNPRTSSGTSGLAITSISDLVVVGGGNGNNNYGGGGGGAYVTSSSMSIGSSVVVTIGAGGGNFTSGNASSIAGSTTVTANGGVRQNANSEDGGASGNGNAGGLGSNTSGGGGGGAGGVGGNANVISNPGGGIGGAGINGYGSGGGGAGGDFGNEKNGSPTGNGPANTGQGGGPTPNILGGPQEAFGGSGFAQFKYWGP
jgi:hypothetical protein